MNLISQTTIFARWLSGLTDAEGKGLILARIEAARLGNFGDSEPVGDGVSEMRIHFGPGYRVYYMREGYVLYLLLCGGDKSTQKADIRKARSMAARVKEDAKATRQAGREAAKASEKSSGKRTGGSSTKTKGGGKSSGKARKG